MNLIEANIILVLVTLSYVEDFSYSIRIYESTSSFERNLRRFVKFWQHRKKWDLDSGFSSYV